ncbi:MAG: NAD(P)H-quinone oxidoreductase, partial [Myxococcota bacterium]
MTMRAVRIREPGGPDVLQIGEVELREPGPHEVRVRVAAAGLNRADCLQRMGVYPAPPGALQDVPGLELAGTIEAVGEAVREREIGERVMAITAGGAMAEYALLHARECLAVPDGLSLEDAAALPEAFITAFDALEQASFRAGETALIHAVGSGVGTAAVQLVRHLGGRSIGTSRTETKLERARELGLDEAIHVTDKTFAKAVRSLGGADVILDFIGAAYLEENVKAVNLRGRIVHIGLLGGASGTLNLGRLLQKRVTLIGTVLRSRPIEEKIALIQRFARLVPAFGDALKPVVADVLPMAEIARAHERI